MWEKLLTNSMDKEPHIQNVYDTRDPFKLLQLKRLEAAALLDVLRYINHADMTISHLCTIVELVLRAQLGVKKMAFYFFDQEKEEAWIEGILSGLDTISEDMLDEILPIKTIEPATLENLPLVEEYGAEYVVPITHQEDLVAFFLVADFADSEVEAQNDLIFIETIGYIMAVAIRNRQLFQEKMKQEFIRKELEVAETIQKQLLISDFDRFGAIDVFGINEPHHGIGGDFYDIISKDDQSIFLCIADVAGKGIGAALLMANLQAHLRALTAQYSDLRTIIFELNETLHQITEGEKFVTLFLARVDLANQTFAYINAGHNPPFWAAQDQMIRLDQGSMLLGILPDLGIEQGQQAFQAGDTLLMFTDGVVEQTNQAGEMYTSERIGKNLTDHLHLQARDLVKYLRNDLGQFAHETENQDDITMLCVKF